MNWGIGTDIYNPHIFDTMYKIDNKNLQYSTRESIQCYVVT